MLSVTKTYTGTCDETYTLTGAFTGPDSFSGTFSMSFSGICFDCSTQSFPVQLLR